MSNKTTKWIGFVGLSQVAFIVLKLCNIITWSWIDDVFVLILIVIAVIDSLKGGGQK